MPIYEFRCQGCQKRVSLLVRRVSDSPHPGCPHCGHKELSRVISSFAYHKSEHTPLGGPDYYKDPRNIGRWTEHRLKELGIDMRSEEYGNTFPEARQMIDAAREGEMPPPLKDL